MINRQRLILPGDAGWNDDTYKKFHWNRLRAAARLPTKPGAKVLIDGFFIRDTRVSPPRAVFKNCSFEWKDGPITADTIRVEEVVPFVSAYETVMFLKRMHLSQLDEAKMEIIALAQDPGLGEPMPNVMFLSQKELRQR